MPSNADKRKTAGIRTGITIMRRPPRHLREDDVKSVLKLTTGLMLTMSLASAASAETSMGIVVKIGGIPWFNAMEEGIKASWVSAPR